MLFLLKDRSFVRFAQRNHALVICWEILFNSFAPWCNWQVFVLIVLLFSFNFPFTECHFKKGFQFLTVLIRKSWINVQSCVAKGTELKKHDSLERAQRRTAANNRTFYSIQCKVWLNFVYEKSFKRRGKETRRSIMIFLTWHSDLKRIDFLSSLADLKNVQNKLLFKNTCWKVSLRTSHNSRCIGSSDLDGNWLILSKTFR